MARTRDRKDLHLWRDPTYKTRANLPMCSCCDKRVRNWKHALYPHLCEMCRTTRTRRNETATQRHMLQRLSPADVTILSRAQQDELLNLLLHRKSKTSQEARLIAELQELRPLCACGKRKIRLFHTHCANCIAESKVTSNPLPVGVQSLNATVREPRSPIEPITDSQRAVLTDNAQKFREYIARNHITDEQRKAIAQNAERFRNVLKK